MFPVANSNVCSSSDGVPIGRNYFTGLPVYLDTFSKNLTSPHSRKRNRNAKGGNDMLFFDTHAHYDWKEFDKDRRELFDKFNENLCGLVNIGINLDSAMKVKEYANEYSYMYYSIGIFVS